MAQLLGGDLTMQSELGVGTTMTVTLPLRLAATLPSATNGIRMSPAAFLAQRGHLPRHPSAIQTSTPGLPGQRSPQTGSGRTRHHRWAHRSHTGDASPGPPAPRPAPETAPVTPLTTGTDHDSIVSVDSCACGDAVLIVADDCLSSRRLFKSMMQRIGGPALLARTLFAENGREALDHFIGSRSVGLVILDIHMPEMDGFQAMRAMRTHIRRLANRRKSRSAVSDTACHEPEETSPHDSEDAEVSNGSSADRELDHASDPDPECCPILALSADAFAEQREQAIASGFNGYITKPVSLAQLRSLLQTHRFI
jgi:CheY-like chemotaxis protein